MTEWTKRIGNPEPDGARVAVKLASGQIVYGFSDDFDWKADGDDEIVEWRLSIMGEPK